MPSSLNYVVLAFVQQSFAVKFVVFEVSLESLSALKILDPVSFKHSIDPVALILFYFSFSIEGPKPCLPSFIKISFISASIFPPKSSPTMSPPILKFSLINVCLILSPTIHSSSILFILFELPDIVVPIQEVELGISFDFSWVEFPKDNLLSVFIVTNSFSFRPTPSWLP